VGRRSVQIARSREADDAERALGRAVAIGLPLATLAGAVVVGLLGSLGSALLVLAAGALLGTIAFLWASVRTLSGDAPLAEGLDEPAERDDVKMLLDEKRRALRALKDLESEHALGKIDDADYERVAAEYRDEAKRVMRSIDAALAPYREKAEELAREYLQKQEEPAVVRVRKRRSSSEKARPRAERVAEGSGDAGDAIEPSPRPPSERLAARLEEPEPPTAPVLPEPDRSKKSSERVACSACGASNEGDAAFCKQCGASMRARNTVEKSDVSA
jgi:hypothetical protein